jgi:predicted aconitase
MKTECINGVEGKLEQRAMEVIVRYANVLGAGGNCAKGPRHT